VFVDLGTNTASQTGGIARLENFIGGTATGDSLTGPNIQNAWDITATDTGKIVNTSGQIDFTSFENLDGGSDIDTFDFQANLTGDARGHQGNDTFTVNTAVSIGGNLSGDDNDDTFVIQPDGHVVGNLNGNAGDDRLDADYIGTSNRALIFHGGANNDLIQLKDGGATAQGLYAVGPATDQGAIQYMIGANSQIVIFSGLEPIHDVMTADTLTVTASDGSDMINMVDGVTVLGATTTELNFAGAFEKILFANKNHLVVNGGFGNDSFTLNNPNSADGLADWTINGGAGNDDLSLVQSGDNDPPVIFNGGVNDDTLAVNYSGGFDETVTFHGDLNNDLIQIIGGAATAVGTYTVGPGADAGTINYTIGSDTLGIDFTGLEPIEDVADAAQLTIEASTGGDTINIIDGPTVLGDVTTEVDFAGAFELIRFANKTTVVVDGQAGNDVFNLNNANPAAGLAQLTIQGQAGDDTLEINYSGINNQTVSFQGGALENDVLRLIGGAAGAAGDYTVGPAADAGTVNYTIATKTLMVDFTGLDPIEDIMTAASLAINASAAGDTINVIDGAVVSGNPTTEVNFGGAFELVRFANKSLVTISGLGGSDNFVLDAPSSTIPIDIHGGDDDDTVTFLQGLGNPGDFHGDAGDGRRLGLLWLQFWIVDGECCERFRDWNQQCHGL